MSRLDTKLAAYWLLTIATWLLVNVLAGVGAVTLLFMLMANGTWHGLFVEAGGLARHFLDAPLAARRDFECLAAEVLISAVALTCAVRFHALRTDLAAADRRETHVR